MFSLFLMKAAGLIDRTETRQAAVVQDPKINILEPQPKGHKKVIIHPFSQALSLFNITSREIMNDC